MSSFSISVVTVYRRPISHRPNICIEQHVASRRGGVANHQGVSSLYVQCGGGLKAKIPAKCELIKAQLRKNMCSMLAKCV